MIGVIFILPLLRLQETLNFKTFSSNFPIELQLQVVQDPHIAQNPHVKFPIGRRMKIVQLVQLALINAVCCWLC